MMAGNRKFIWLGVSLLALGIVAMVIFFARRGDAVKPEVAEGGVASVTVSTLRLQPMTISEELPGTINAVRHAELSPKVMGKLLAVFVNEGEKVHAGQLLARLEGNDLASNVLQAKAGVQGAQAAFQQAKTGYTMQQAQSAVAIQQAQAGLETAQAQLAKAKQGPRPEQILQADEAERRAKAGYEQATAYLSMIKEGSRAQQKLQAEQGVLAAEQQVSQAEAGLASAKAALANVQADYTRMDNLYQQGIIAKQRFDAVAMQLEMSKQAVNQASAGLKQAKSGVAIANAQANLVNEGARSQEVTAAEKQQEQAHAGYEQAKQEAIMAHQGGRWEDIKSAEQAVAQAKSGVAAAKAAQARDQVSEKDIVRASAGIAQARAGLSGAQTMVGYTSIVAPFSGVITSRKADPGTMAMPSMPILAIDDDSVYQLVSQVPEKLAANLSVGDRVMVTIDSLNDTLPATISEIVPSADPSSRTLTVKANLPYTKRLKSGLFGRLSLKTGSKMQLMIPKSAVIDRNGLTGVYLLDAAGKARFALVTLGKSERKLVQVLSGLQEGDQIVTSRVKQVKPGQMLRVEGAAL